MDVRLTVVLIWILAGSVFAMGQSQPAVESGIDLYRAGNYQKAIEVLQHTVAVDKRDKFAWAYLGAAHLKLGDTKNAIRAFKRSDLTYKDPPENGLDKPVKTLRKPRATYTNNARQNGVTGDIKVAVELKADGTIGFAFPFQTLPDGLTENAVRAAKSVEFEPAMKNGKAVDAVTVVIYSFAIY